MKATTLVVPFGWSRAAQAGLTFRRIAAADLPFLARVYASTRAEALLRDLMDEAAAAGKAVSIHVEKYNPAMRLYRRLGFTVDEDKGVYDLMRWIRS
jgi:hypothetical protein